MSSLKKAQNPANSSWTCSLDLAGGAGESIEKKLSKLAEVISKHRPSSRQVRDACRDIARQFGVREKDVRALFDAAVFLHRHRPNSR
jgi:hypothetical protein